MPKTNVSVPHKKLDNIIAWVLTIAGAGGIFASLMLSIEEFHFLKHPHQQLACDINPLIGCGNILNTWQGHVFLGIPNQFLGLIAFTVVTTLGVLLLAKVSFPKWIWQGLQAGMFGGLVFISWFFIESLFVLKHLCPYCMLTWTVTIALVWYTTLYNLQTGTLPVKKPLERAKAFVLRHHADILIVFYVIIVASILTRFWSFFGANL